MRRATLLGAVTGLALVAGAFWKLPSGHAQATPPKPSYASQAEADRKSQGCLSCHTQTDSRSMHTAEVAISCVDCHGGDPAVGAAGEPGSAPYREALARAHVQPKNPEVWKGSANPERSYAASLDEDLAFVRFVNPGDLRAAPTTCGPCHRRQVREVEKSPMTHGGMLYAAALYNNGVLPMKNAVVGESYDPATGLPRIVNTVPPPTPEETRDRGWLASLYPFPRWELGVPGNPFRVFERGGRRRLEVGLPDPFEEAGKPDKGLSPRGMGTLNRTDPILLGAQKTRLLDPLLSFLGTNDHPGDYRSSGCTACHVVYANDRDPLHSGTDAAHGNRGASASADPTIPRDQPGHPVRHRFTNAIPSSQCMTCHMHPGTNMVSTYFGYTWWDNEVDGKHMYPKEPLELDAAQQDAIERRNPEGAAKRGLWGDPTFLADVSKLNPQLEHTQFADFHGHGWVFRAVYKKDRKGRLLDARNQPVADDDPQKLAKAVHLRDVHLERGMHCVDCHFQQDNHGDGKLYGEPRPAVEIDCADCHGSEKAATTLVTSGPASKGMSLLDLRTPFGEPRFEKQGDRIVQRSMVEKRAPWVIPQTITAGSAEARSAHSKHSSDGMTCYACHSSWTTTCVGCHLSMEANEKKPALHAEGGESRNWTSYNFQTLRDDAYFLARDGWVGPQRTGDDGKPVRQRIAPARSACAVLASSQNQNREWIYSQQQTVSSAGFAGTSFSTYVPHTVGRKGEAKACGDCHVNQANDNNAWMASLLLQGTGLMNFIGRYAYVGQGEHGFEAVAVTEREEPQAVIGSRLHELAYPTEFATHRAAGAVLREAYHHDGDVRSLQLRGEYLFAAQGAKGLRIYDVAQVDHKGFSERMVTAPVSPLGQKLYVDTKDATSVGLPSTMTIDPVRTEKLPADLKAANQEQPVHPLYDHAFVTDREEGLVVVGPLHVLLDGDPTNNFVKRVATFDGGGALRGATSIAFAGTVAYVTTPTAVVVLDLASPASPRVMAQVPMRGPRAVSVQFRYAFVIDEAGLSVLNVTDPSAPVVVTAAAVAIPDARSLYVARTYVYVAAGAKGLAIVDVEKPEQPKLDRWFDAGGALNDAHDVKIGFTNGSGFAYVADGKNGLRVVQVISANDTPGAYGFSPRPTPTLVATYKTHGPALALSRGLDRDRAVDETGNQIGVFGRRGARPFNADEMKRLMTMRPVP
jgi:hypothetical protein